MTFVDFIIVFLCAAVFDAGYKMAENGSMLGTVLIIISIIGAGIEYSRFQKKSKNKKGE